MWLALFGAGLGFAAAFAVLNGVPGEDKTSAVLYGAIGALLFFLGARRLRLLFVLSRRGRLTQGALTVTHRTLATRLSEHGTTVTYGYRHGTYGFELTTVASWSRGVPRLPKFDPPQTRTILYDPESPEDAIFFGR